LLLAPKLVRCLHKPYPSCLETGGMGFDGICRFWYTLDANHSFGKDQF